MSVKSIKGERDFLRWFVSLMMFFTLWYWIIERPGINQIILDWKNMRSAKAYQYDDLKDMINKVEAKEKEREGGFVRKSELTQSSFIGNSSANSNEYRPRRIPFVIGRP